MLSLRHHTGTEGYPCSATALSAVCCTHRSAPAKTAQIEEEAGSEVHGHRGHGVLQDNETFHFSAARQSDVTSYFDRQLHVRC